MTRRPQAFHLRELCSTIQSKTTSPLRNRLRDKIPEARRIGQFDRPVAAAYVAAPLKDLERGIDLAAAKKGQFRQIRLGGDNPSSAHVLLAENEQHARD